MITTFALYEPHLIIYGTWWRDLIARNIISYLDGIAQHLFRDLLTIYGIDATSSYCTLLVWYGLYMRLAA